MAASASSVGAVMVIFPSDNKAQVKPRPVYLARSGKTMEFDGQAKCVSGC